MNYSFIDWIYRLFDIDGVIREEISAWWDVVENTGGGATNQPGNEPPSIDPVGNQALDRGASITVDILIDDRETSADDLLVGVTTSRPDLIGELLVTGTGMMRQISFISSALRSGSASVSATVSDGTDTRSVSFSVLIDVDMTPFEGYLAAYFAEDEIFDPSIVSPIFDPDHDGLATILEYLLGTNPREFNQSSEAMTITHNSGPDERTIDLTFKRRVDDPLIEGFFWGSNNMKDWTRLDTSNPIYQESAQQGENAVFEDVSATVTLPPDTDSYFIRYQTLGTF